MARHPLDQSSGPEGKLRVRRFLNVERARNPARATLQLQRRQRNAAAAYRLKAFLRIARATSG